MSVSVIKSTEPKNANIYTAAAVGAAMGVGVRRFLPVYQPEMDAVLFGEFSEIKENNIKQARKFAMNNILKVSKDKKTNKKAVELLLERMQASAKYYQAQEQQNEKAKKAAVELAKKAKEKIKKAPKKVKEELAILSQRALNLLKASRLLSDDAVKSAVKNQRPYGSFILPGVALGLLSAFVYNVVGIISRD